MRFVLTRIDVYVFLNARQFFISLFDDEEIYRSIPNSDFYEPNLFVFGHFLLS